MGKNGEEKGVYIEKILIFMGAAIVVLLCVICVILGRLIALRSMAATETTERTEKAIEERSYRDAPKVTAADMIPQDEGAVRSSDMIEKPKQAPPNYEVVMNTEWKFRAGERMAKNAYVENSKNNRNDVYFTLTVDDYPGTEFFRSEVLKPGESVYKIELVSALPEGVYDGTVTYRLLDDAGNGIGRVETGVILRVGDH